MIKQRLPDLGQLITASDMWSAGHDKDFWLANDRGNLKFSEAKPDKVFAAVRRTKDLDAIESVDEPTVYVEWPSGRALAFFPDSWEDNAPYEGRIFSIGQFDCYSLVRDWCYRERGYELPKQTESMENLRANFQTVFTESTELDNWEEVVAPRPGDGIFFSIRATSEISIPNHCGIYLENNMFLHHMANRLSVIEPLSDSWRSRIVKFLRYRNG